MSEKYTCEIYCSNEGTVNHVREQIKQEDISSVSKIFKLLSDENRAKIVYALCQEDELCVCDLSNIIDSSVATASHHLRALHNMGLTKYRKEGKFIYYSLDDEHIKQLFLIASTHLKELPSNVK